MILSYVGPEEVAEPFIGAHVDYLERWHAEGVFLVSGQTVPSVHGGAIVARGIDRPEVERIAAADPFVVAGVATYAITTIEPGRVHRSLAESLVATSESQLRG
ncbi:YciI family protein [Micromonospora sp. NPDC003197]